MVLLGIDPDTSGALAVVRWQHSAAAWDGAAGLPAADIDVYDMPTMRVETGSRARKCALCNDGWCWVTDVLAATALMPYARRSRRRPTRDVLKWQLTLRSPIFSCCKPHNVDLDAHVRLMSLVSFAGAARQTPQRCQRCCRACCRRCHLAQ